MRQKVIFLFFFLLSINCKGQEINCSVSVNSDKIEGTDKTIFIELQTSISNFLNQNKFTNRTVLQNEKIECSMLIIVKSVLQDIFSCEMILQTKRPVYNSSYTTTLLNFKDERFNFKYNQFDKIEFLENQASYTNIEALLTYYAYLIIGYDEDSFEKLGGSTYFKICESIVSTMQTSNLDKSELTGWSSLQGNRNRYIIINNLLDEAFRNFRSYVYTYHRQGLDEMNSSVVNARARINNGIAVLKEAYKARTTACIISMFLDAKAGEIVDIYSKASPTEKKNAYDVLISIDPTREEEYKKILN